jgi:glyoxylase-like metal-dependent hydrolase (beta-lactamase superfamily II)
VKNKRIISINLKTLIGMLSNGIQAPQVDTICITHPDTDTMGNLNLFPCAEVNEIIYH